MNYLYNGWKYLNNRITFYTISLIVSASFVPMSSKSQKGYFYCLCIAKLNSPLLVHSLRLQVLQLSFMYQVFRLVQCPLLVEPMSFQIFDQVLPFTHMSFFCLLSLVSRLFQLLCMPSILQEVHHHQYACVSQFPIVLVPNLLFSVK